MITVEQLCVQSGLFRLDNVSFEIGTAQYAVLMGKTGSGKTTLLEALCGLKAIVAGRITLLGREVTRLKTPERDIGYVPQDLALFPTMTVREQLGFALMIRRWTRAAIERRVGELADLLELRPLLPRRPQGLSGGEAQRVALGRALAYQPRILLLDEPLSALDESTRAGMYELLRRVQHETGVTTLHVTHSLTEARVLADVLLVLEQGTVRRQALPSDLDQAERPQSGSAAFVGAPTDARSAPGRSVPRNAL